MGLQPIQCGIHVTHLKGQLLLFAKFFADEYLNINYYANLRIVICLEAILKMNVDKVHCNSRQLLQRPAIVSLPHHKGVNTYDMITLHGTKTTKTLSRLAQLAGPKLISVAKSQ